MAVESFDLTFYPTQAALPPTAEQLEQEIQNCGFTTMRLEPSPEAFAAWSEKEPEKGAIYYFLLGRPEEVYVNIIGCFDSPLHLVLALLQDRSRNACLQVDGRPVLTQMDGQLRLDLERFWNKRRLQIVQDSRDFVRARVLHDYCDQGFFQEDRAEPQWEQCLLQALVNVFTPGTPAGAVDENLDLRVNYGFNPDDPRFVEEFQRLSGSRLFLDPTRVSHTLKDLRSFLEVAAPNMHFRQPLLPAVLIGGPLRIETRPDWLHFFWHQHGGYKCLNADLNGALLPLHLNRWKAHRDPGDVLDGLEAMAEAPDRDVLARHYPGLKGLCPTWGSCYTEQALAYLHGFLSDSYRLPSFSAGREALIEMTDCDPQEWFAGWQMVTITDDGTGVRNYTSQTREELLLRYGPELKCYLLWNNSD